ncbi:hypothetical protein [Archangium lipolyticum]|uniref:hypothetical protein n=1 Tax=Archangium lipolyticum TaxID=2970465 RepID=UPI00214A4799|nr:hypothetical protein [Archangium lipolyticum]
MSLLTATCATSPRQAATLLEYVGRREDADLLAEHKLQEEVLGRVYEEAAEVLPPVGRGY